MMIGKNKILQQAKVYGAVGGGTELPLALLPRCHCPRSFKVMVIVVSARVQEVTGAELSDACYGSLRRVTNSNSSSSISSSDTSAGVTCYDSESTVTATSSFDDLDSSTGTVHCHNSADVRQQPTASVINLLLLAFSPLSHDTIRYIICMEN